MSARKPGNRPLLRTVRSAHRGIIVARTIPDTEFKRERSHDSDIAGKGSSYEQRGDGARFAPATGKAGGSGGLSPGRGAGIKFLQHYAGAGKYLCDRLWRGWPGGLPGEIGGGGTAAQTTRNSADGWVHRQ